MNCPGHFLVFASEVRSYRDLPIRFHEQTPLHRNEASGVLSGLTRVRQFSQDDAHCFVTQEQIGEEVERLLRLVQRVYGDFGLPFTAKLSTRPDEFLGEVATWDHAEAQLKAALERAGHGLHDQREATARSTGRRSTSTSPTRSAGSGSAPRSSSTTSMPERFDLKYIGADNAEHRPVVIHRAIFGSFERFIAHPDRALRRRVSALAGAGAGDRAADCRPAPGLRRGSVRDRLTAAGLRVELDERQEKIGYKIREAQLQKIPYMLVVGRPGGGRGHGRRCAAAPAATRERRRWTRSSTPRARKSRAKGDEDADEPRRRRRSAAALSLGGRYRFRQKPAPRRPRAGQRTHPGPRNPRDRRHRRAARHHAAAAGAGHRASRRGSTWSRSRRRRAAGLPHHGLRASTSTRSRSARARRKKHQKVIEVKEIKFRPKVDEHDYQFKKKHIERFLDGRRQGQGDDLLPRPRDGAPGDRPAHSRAADRGAGGGGDRRDDAAAGRQPDAHDPERSAPGAKRRAKPRRRRPAARDRDQTRTSTEEHERRERTMPKLKTHRGAAKRFKQTENGQVPARQGVQAAHPDAARRRKRKRGLRGTTIVADADQRRSSRGCCRTNEVVRLSAVSCQARLAG